ncbi:MAG: 30S ribosomal protein S9 [Endomicrobium sp.]|jgi:small subunit ribosomal protein S9|nr:30S ribosomal protein S9 [Endomicrobium sp.]
MNNIISRISSITNSVGRRKKAIAVVKVYSKKVGSNTNNKIIINNKLIEDYFKLERFKNIVLKPICLCHEFIKEYDFNIRVSGGGISGQASASSLGIARAILKINKLSKQVLRKEGMLTRDPRMVERKKPGKPKARKRFQFSKR